MKRKLTAGLFVLCLMVPLALARSDAATAAATDDAKMARLRFAYVVLKGPNVDVLIDGEIATNPGQPQANIPCCQVTGYLYLAPGSYSVAVVPTGEDAEEALLGPLDVTLEAGHRYTLTTIGQLEDTSFMPLIINETAVVQEVRTSPEQSVMILVNNLAGAETLSITFNGQGPKDAPYGGFAAAPVPFGPERYIEVSANGGEDVIETDQWDEHSDTEGIGDDFMHLRFGRFPGTWGVDHSDIQGVSMSELHALAYLRGYSGVGAQQEGHILSYDTFLEAVETAGLAELLTTGGPFLIFAPTDEAFAALPEGQLGRLMADPEALADWLGYHIVEGYYPPGSFSGEVYGSVDRTLSNLTGSPLRLFTFGDTFYINGIPQGGLQRTGTADGSYVRPITTALLPPDN